MDSTKKGSCAMYGIIAVCLFMPFINVSCSGVRVLSMTGVQLAAGMVYEEPDMFGENGKSRKIPPEPLAVAAVILIVMGLAFSLSPGRSGSTVIAITSGAGAGVLLMLKAKLDQDVIKQGEGLLQLDYGFGYWSSLALLISITLLNVFSRSQHKSLMTDSTVSQQKAEAVTGKETG